MKQPGVFVLTTVFSELLCNVDQVLGPERLLWLPGMVLILRSSRLCRQTRSLLLLAFPRGLRLLGTGQDWHAEVLQGAEVRYSALVELSLALLLQAALAPHICVVLLERRALLRRLPLGWWLDGLRLGAVLGQNEGDCSFALRRVAQLEKSLLEVRKVVVLELRESD